MTGFVAPWTAEQVTHLNAFQRSGRMHPFTCGQRDQHPNSEGVLVATEAGWHCPAMGCDYQQDWAHTFMAAPLAPNPIYDALDKAREERAAGIVRAVHLGRRAPAGRLIYLANRLEAALKDGTLLPSVLATIAVLRDTASELEGNSSD